MVQYKMLTTHTDPATVKTDWIFRPDEQFKLEVGRMNLLPVKGTPSAGPIPSTPPHNAAAPASGQSIRAALLENSSAPSPPQPLAKVDDKPPLHTPLAIGVA
jgi:hypothetical protein